MSHPPNLRRAEPAIARARTFMLRLGWLICLVVTFAVPLSLDWWQALDYMASLLFWLIPIAYLSWTFLTVTSGGQGRRRTALLVSAGSIVVLGVVLDFLFGHRTLRFPDCAAPDWGQYWLCLPAVGGAVPVEEVLFYALGPVAMIMVYACADEVWLRHYNPADELLNARLVQFSRSLGLTFAVAVAVLFIAWLINGTFPTYAAFLTAGALLPAIFLYRCIGSLTNWPAFAVTVLYVVVTSVVWEVTLAIPRGWWGYERSGMLGWEITAWSRGEAMFPIEAAFVWICAPFFTVLLYEFAKAFMHHPRRGIPRVALFG